MSSYADFLHRYRGFAGNPLMKYKSEIDALYNRSHGGARYFLSQLPFTGGLRQFQDTMRKWDDAYANTGRDPNYSTQYGSAGIPFLNDAVANLGKPMKMAKSLSDMYAPEVEHVIYTRPVGNPNAIHMYPKDRLIGNAYDDLDYEMI